MWVSFPDWNDFAAVWGVFIVCVDLVATPTLTLVSSVHPVIKLGICRSRFIETCSYS